MTALARSCRVIMCAVVSLFEEALPRRGFLEEACRAIGRL